MWMLCRGREGERGREKVELGLLSTLLDSGWAQDHRVVGNSPHDFARSDRCEHIMQ